MTSMDAVDDEEARILAARWVNDIKANIGLGCLAADVGQHSSEGSSKQVHINNDVSDKNARICGYNGGKQICTDYAECTASVLPGHASEMPSHSGDFVDEQNKVGRSLNPYLDTKTRNGIHFETNINFDMRSKFTDGHVMPKEKDIVGDLALNQGKSATNEELFDIWGFDEEQREHAKCYLEPRGVIASKVRNDSDPEKENLEAIVTKSAAENKHFASASDKNCQGNNVLSSLERFAGTVREIESKPKDSSLNSTSNNGKNHCKLCPSCGESNLVNANWCEECGKAMLSVKVTSKPDKQSNRENIASPCKDITSSNLNPNCAEFVSAYATPPSVAATKLTASATHCANMRVVNGKSEDSSSFDNFHMNGNPLTSRTQSLKINHFSSSNEKEHGEPRSFSYTDGCQYDMKNIHASRNTKRSKYKKGRSSSFNSVVHDKGMNGPVPHSFEMYDHTDTRLLNISPRNWYFHGSPTTVHNIHSFNQQTGSSPVFGHQSPILQDGLNAQIHYPEIGVMTAQSPLASINGLNNQVKFQRPNDQPQGISQGFDFQNPVLENPQNPEQITHFDEAQFSRAYVQAALQQQVEHAYGTWNMPQMGGWSEPGFHGFYNPEGCYNIPGNSYQYHRVYSKKRVVESSVESPRTPKSILKNDVHSKDKIGNSKQTEQTFKQQTYMEHLYSSPQSRDLSTDASKISPVAVPPLKLEDLENYDQILTLIRTSRDEMLPYLCLPEEIILYIFSYLSTSDLCRCARVCRQFNRISMDESLWKEIFIKKKNDISDETLDHVARKCPVSLTITQCHSNKVTEEGLRNLFRSCGDGLEDLDFSACSGKALIGELILLHVSSRCRNIRSLDISWSNVSDIGIQAVSEAVERLECICINGCQSVTDEAVRCIANRHGDSIRVIEMFGCFNISHVSLMILKQYCPNMETLNIGQCHKVSDASVAEFARKAKRLENIDLRGCKQIRDNAIKVIASNCPKLSTLVIANCPFVTDASLVTIASTLKNIRCIDVCGCPKIADRGIQALAKSCSKLQMLDFSSTKASDKAVISLANYCCQTLKAVKMSFCKNITDGSVEHLAKKCFRLTLLHLYGCKRVKNLRKIQDCNTSLVIES